MNKMRDLTNITGFVYKITAPNGAVYIGQTINIKSRKHDYKSGEFKGQTKLWNSCQKYNWNPSETFEVIDECLCGSNKESINDKEIFWISYYDSFENGLNCTEGGKGQLSRIWSDAQKLKQSQLINEMYKNNKIPLNPKRGHKLSEEHKEKIINSLKDFHNNNDVHWNKGKITRDEIKQKIINSTTGENNHFYGKEHTPETKEKMRNHKLGKTLSEETKRRMSESQQKRIKKYKVIQYDMNNNFVAEFESIKVAAEKTNILEKCIYRVLKGIRKSTNKFIWKFA